MAGAATDNHAHVAASRGVYWAAALVMLAFVAAIWLCVDLASREADRVVLDRELDMVRLEADAWIQTAADREAEFTYWDDAVRAIVKNDNPAQGSISEKDREWILDDLGFSAVVVVDRLGRVKYFMSAAILDREGFASKVAAEHAGLIGKARGLFLERRVKTGSRYVVPEIGRNRIAGIHAGEFAMIYGEPAIVVAQAIVPESDEFALREDEIDIAVAVAPISEAAIRGLGERLRLHEPQFLLADAAPEFPRTQIHLPRISSGAGLALVWRPEAPRPKILGTTVPFAAAVCIAIGLILAFIVRRHGKAVAKLAESEVRNRYLAAHDQLTGLLNRTAFDAAISGLAGKPGRQAFGLLCVDLDRFKAINDTHGHPAGDAVLRAVGQRLMAQLDGHGFVARLGGDEFIAVIDKWHGDDAAMWLADAIVAAICRPVLWHGIELEVGASVGVACWPRDGETVRELIASADAGLYAAKRAGRGRARSVLAMAAEPERISA
jgi:diguanylate cyclase (GGDEF)-like protein